MLCAGYSMHHEVAVHSMTVHPIQIINKSDFPLQSVMVDMMDLESYQ